MKKHKITPTNAKVYEQLFELKKYSFGVVEITQCIATVFDVSIEEMQSSSRKQEYVGPRQIAIFFIKHLTTLSLKDVANFFGGRDHTTAIHSINTVHDLMDTEQEYHDKLLDIARQMKQLHPTPV